METQENLLIRNRTNVVGGEQDDNDEEVPRRRLEVQEQEQQQQQQQQQYSAYGDNCDRFHKIKFKILRTKFCNHLAYRYYSKRQMYLSYLPLQLLAMVITIIGYLGAGKGAKTECKDEEKGGGIDAFSLVDGILGTVMIFLISLVRM